MSNNQKLVRYCLTPEGEIPDYILTDIYGGMCSLWGIETNNRPWPQNLEVIGVTKKNIVVEEFDTILEVFDTSDKLFTYMSTFLSGQSKTVSENVETTQEDPGKDRHLGLHPLPIACSDPPAQQRKILQCL